MDPAFAAFQARLNTFAPPKGKSRRPSNRGKKPASKAADKGGWPLSFPRPEDLAYAGFIFKPTSVSLDNVQCFSCQTQLDGWEETDVPAFEHLTHSPNCGFAINVCIRLRASDPGRAEDDPQSEAMLEARKQTFLGLWPLEEAAGFPGIDQMVDGGWYYDPSEDTPDGVTCPYCCLSLDAWDAGDDPTEEHRKRAPECLFFTLREFYHPALAPKPKAGRKKRASSASSTTSRTTGKATRAKKGATKDELNKPLPQPPDETMMDPTTNSFGESFAASAISTSSKAPAKRGRKTRKASAQVEQPTESIAESFATSVASAPTKAPARKGRKPKNTATPLEEPVVVIADSFAESVASTTSKATTKGRKPKAAAQRPSTVSTTSTARSTRATKRRSDEMEIDETLASPEPLPKRTRLSDISLPAFESTPVNTPRELRQTEKVKSPLHHESGKPGKLMSPFHHVPVRSAAPSKGPLSPVRQPQSRTPGPQTPEKVRSSPVKWDPVVISEILADARFDKENFDIDMSGTAEDVTQAVLASLTSPEKRMTIQEFVLHNAKRGEEKLRMECQRQIAVFEAEGRRALAALDAY